MELTHLLSLPLRLNWEGNTNVRIYHYYYHSNFSSAGSVLNPEFRLPYLGWVEKDRKWKLNYSHKFQGWPKQANHSYFMSIRMAQPQSWGTESFSGWVREIKGIEFKQKNNNNNFKIYIYAYMNRKWQVCCAFSCINI